MPKGKENVDKSKIEAVDKSAKKETKVDESNLVNKSETKIVKKIIEDKPSEEDEKNANNFNSYLEESGLPEAFQLIFSELVSKKINTQNYFSYVSMRLRQLGKEINELKNQEENDNDNENENNENMDEEENMD